MPFQHFKYLTPAEIPGIRLGSVPDRWRCRAKAKSTGERCQCLAVKGRATCRHHGSGSKKTRAGMLRMAARLRGERPEAYKKD